MSKELEKKKIRLITDTIHQSIPVSAFESVMMATPFFYRLHDVYQSSTVYLTFPCNRTKRYEHSIGTMHLAGDMFFSAITNAEEKVKKDFFKVSKEKINLIISEFCKGHIPSYCAGQSGKIRGCFPPSKQNIKDLESFMNGFTFDYIKDVALEHYFPSFSDETQIQKFTYQCILEAVRLVALFHDVGHPPFSHIMESVLIDLYNKCQDGSNEFDDAKKEELVECLKPYADNKELENLKYITKGDKSSKGGELHEKVGITMFHAALETYFKSIFETQLEKRKAFDILVYSVCVSEVAFAMLYDVDVFFVSLHRIIDGVVDADRMDYIVRDSCNSGTTWGKIPYTRIVNSCMMVKYNSHFLIAFPQKMADDIADMMLNRYKIFSRINFHHRSLKTAVILQNLIFLLAEDYLSASDDEEVLCEGIADLWLNLKSTINPLDISIIQWNDSVLVSHLYHTLVCLNEKSYSSELTENNKTILKYLEEFLLNHKHYFALFKQQRDINRIISQVFVEKKKELDNLTNKETSKLNRKLDKPDCDAVDSLHRISPSVRQLISQCDTETFQRIFPSESSISAIIDEVLQKFQDKGKIQSFLFYKNTKRNSIGIPQNTEKKCHDGMRILLYDNSGQIIVYDCSNLIVQITQLQKNCLECIAYIELDDENPKIVSEILEEIESQFSASFGNSLEDYFLPRKEP
ncbi:MAG: hypothetical protein K2O14_00195 [Oscillospiraceae bacterium]|nr:hypothetical protein [Oscillospiraceae bacterium]